MSVDYYLVCRKSRVAFALGKSGGFDLTTEPEDLEDLCARIRYSYVGYAEETPDSYEEMRAAHARGEANYFRADRWVFVPEFGCYISRNTWSGQEDPPLEERIAEHRDDVAYARVWADDVWAFVHDERVGGWANVEIVNDSGDLPWWDPDGPWYQIGSRYTEDRGKVERLDDLPDSTIDIGGYLSPEQVQAWTQRLETGRKP